MESQNLLFRNLFAKDYGRMKVFFFNKNQEEFFL